MPHHEDSQDQPPRKPSNWWAFEREPWKRVNAEILAREKAGADREGQTARSGAHLPSPAPRWRWRMLPRLCRATGMMAGCR
jgi:hypothetical protein